MTDKQTKYWAAANLAGAGVFLFLASSTWIEPELRGEEVARAGDAIVWATAALPVLAGFFILNVVWLVAAVVKAARSQSLSFLAPFAATSATWFCVVVTDLALR